jgi:D-amino-acid oxidase
MGDWCCIGQTCLVSNPCDRTITQQNPDGTWTFIIPRPLDGGTVIGGTKEPHDWEEKPRPETRAKLLEMAAKMYPPILGSEGKFKVIRDIVGRRPARVGGLRLQMEHLKGLFRGKRIIHAYGAEGHGYGLSWGISREVVRMAVEADNQVVVRSSL